VLFLSFSLQFYTFILITSTKKVFHFLLSVYSASDCWQNKWWPARIFQWYFEFGEEETA